ncbi:MAG TPA: transketolase C-terminal domain-containing protein, partial [Bacteroidia bacterium]|nr:transketolase C-terminal domain-containing protein [Bacteroidia bacterium]
SHHALEDIACLGGMQNNGIYVPAFNDDIKPLITEIVKRSKPAYLRLGLGKQLPTRQNRHGSFNYVLENKNSKGTIIALGPIVNNVINALSDPALKDKFNLFTLVSLPMEVDELTYEKITESGNVLVVEEHIAQGGIGQQIGGFLLEKQAPIKRFVSLSAKGYPGKLYGDQAYHQKLSGLDAESIAASLKQLI